MENVNLKRINELAAIARERELTDEEKAERQKLREAYLEDFRNQFRAQLDHTVVEYPDGTRESFKSAGKRNNKT